MFISYDYYRVFYYVAKCRNFTQAASLLMSNQPNVTRTIQNLESQLGCTLFVRSNRGVRLTPEGERLYSHIRIAVEQIHAGEEELSMEKNLPSAAFSCRSSRAFTAAGRVCACGSPIIPRPRPSPRWKITRPTSRWSQR